MDVYGARPVSLDLARSRTLSATIAARSRPRPGPPRLEVLSAVDRLSLAHWSAGQRIAVCSLDGGVGRTAVAGLLAVVLAELPHADTWPPVGLVDTDLNVFSGTPARWAGLASHPNIRRVEAHTLNPNPERGVEGSRPVVVDTSGPVSKHRWLVEDPQALVLMVCRPEPRCLSRMADALTALHNMNDLHRSRIVVLVNDGVGHTSRVGATLATALSIRCAAVHRLPASRRLAADATLPTGPRLDRRLRERIATVAVSLWKQTDVDDRPARTTSDHQEVP